MRHINNSIRSIVVISAFIGLTGVFTASRPSQAQDLADAHLALVKQYCSTCHSDKLKNGAFDRVNARLKNIKFEASGSLLGTIKVGP